jgi:hypothetical protein
MGSSEVMDCIAVGIVVIVLNQRTIDFENFFAALGTFH